MARRLNLRLPRGSQGWAAKGWKAPTTFACAPSLFCNSCKAPSSISLKWMCCIPRMTASQVLAVDPVNSMLAGLQDPAGIRRLFGKSLKGNSPSRVLPLSSRVTCTLSPSTGTRATIAWSSASLTGSPRRLTVQSTLISKGEVFETQNFLVSTAESTQSSPQLMFRLLLSIIFFTEYTCDCSASGLPITPAFTGMGLLGKPPISQCRVSK